MDDANYSIIRNLMEDANYSIIRNFLHDTNYAIIRNFKVCVHEGDVLTLSEFERKARRLHLHTV